MTAASSLPWKSSERSLRVIHNRVLLSVVHFGRRLRPSMALEAGVATTLSALFYRRQGRVWNYKTVFPARVSLLTPGVAFPTRLRRLLGLPSTEGQSRGIRRWAGLMKGHCVAFHPVSSFF
ncbi:unnamed protein product [Lasius platythorax]|uniref:Uncharacterized protein n=1 Tax=Lasius platythorax TaxID=488582 RepID=A0AAV2P043_9HYME